MLSSPETTAELSLETLREGDRGLAVMQLQTQLNELDLYHGDISGQFDAETKQALQRFQSQHALTEEQGFFGPQTWYALSFWNRETEWFAPSVWPAVRRWIVQKIDAAAVQPKPAISASLQTRQPIEPGQLLFWPPFGRKQSETV